MALSLYVHPTIGAESHSKKYYEDDTGNCKWLKESKCSKKRQPKKLREKVCDWEEYQVSGHHTF